jgi:IS5 family transposase
MSVVSADKGYGAAFLRDLLREHNVRPLVKHREFESIQTAHNARLVEDIQSLTDLRGGLPRDRPALQFKSEVALVVSTIP